MESISTVFRRAADVLGDVWPSFLPTFPDVEVLENVWVRALEFERSPTVAYASTAILLETELSLAIPGLDAISLVIAPAHRGAVFPLDIVISPTFRLRMADVPLTLRFESDLFKPVKRVTATSEPGRPAQFELDSDHRHVEISLAKVTLQIDVEGNITLRTDISLDLPPTMIADTGVVIEADNLNLYLHESSRPPGQSAGWKGLHIGHAAVYLPGELAGIVGNTELTDAYIGNGGFSGTIQNTWTPPLNAQLFGMTFELTSVNVAFRQNALTRSGIHGRAMLPFFDEQVDVEVGINLDGSFAVKLDSESGLDTLRKDGLLELELDSLGFEVEDATLTATLSGQITPFFGDLDWPSFQVNELAIDSQGNVRLEGGWLDLREQYSLDFHGFQIEITKLGFGKTEDGGKWIGFSGALKLVEGLSAGASVEGLRITWYEDNRPTQITLNGVGVEFEVPEVLRFKGAVSYQELPGEIHRFDGDIELELLVLDMDVTGQLVIGHDSDDDYNFFAIYLGVELPAGIPLWSTGLALYGMAGLFALEMEPNKAASESWYENADGSPGWYKRSPVGITDLKSKWDPRPGSLALGGGITIGTVADNGFTVSSKMLLAIVFPGPILLLEGRADMLRERTGIDASEEGLFRALAVLDGRSGTFLIGMDARYKIGSGGELIDIRAGAEAFFSLSDLGAWHLYLGEREPREKRIRAQVIKFLEANAYFMLDARQLAVGAWAGYAADWKFGPLRVILESWVEGNVIVSWKPVHYHGDYWVHGKVVLSAFVVRLGLSVDVELAADVFDPFHLLGRFAVGLYPPWPFPDIEVSITLEWGPEPVYPPLPRPLKEIAVEHLKASTSWPLPAGEGLLLPTLDRGNGFLVDSPPTPNASARPPDNTPVVPLDSLPHITFGRHVNDDAKAGVNNQLGIDANNQPGTDVWERIGNPDKDEGPVSVRYGLKEVHLDKWVGSAWTPVAQKIAEFNATTNRWEAQPNPSGVDELFGSWAPVPAMPDGGGEAVSQVKLWLWSKTPFDYTRHTGRAWDEWFTDRFNEYPCVPDAPDREVCCNFERITPSQPLNFPWICPDHPEITLLGGGPGSSSVVVLAQSVAGKRQALCLDGQTHITIQFAPPAKAVEIIVTAKQPGDIRECVDFAGLMNGPNPRIEQRVVFETRDRAGRPSNMTRIGTLNNFTGLNCHYELEITLPCAAKSIELTMIRQANPVKAEAFNTDGVSVGSAQLTGPLSQPEALALQRTDIARLLVSAPENEVLLLQMCYVCSNLASATGIDVNGNTVGPMTADGSVIRLSGQDLTSVRVDGGSATCIVQICATLPADAAESARRQEMAEQLRNEMARWSQVGKVLEPHTGYRLQIVTTLQARGEGELSGENRNYTLTEFAYFRTEGPPGLTRLSLPVGQFSPGTISVSNGSPDINGVQTNWNDALAGAVLQVRGESVPYDIERVDSANTLFLSRNYNGSTRSDLAYSIQQFDSGLDDLTRYVKQTVPATVPAEGEQPLLPRPVYRAYDVGAEFDETCRYVDLMYRLDRRDLGLYLYDNNNRPVRDAQGRLIVLSNRWGETEDLTLTESETFYITLINASDCAEVDLEPIPHQKTLFSATQGQVLEADTVYEARLVPLLLHEDFTEDLTRWETVNEGSNNAPAHWEVRTHQSLSGEPATAVVQTSNIWGGTNDGIDPVKPGTMLLRGANPSLPADDPEQPVNWTDYRFSVYLRTTDGSQTGGNAIGVVFRYLNSNNYYRFSMDRRRQYRRLVRVASGSYTVLAEDDFVYRLNQDYLITVEAIESSLRVYQDGVLVFSSIDDSLRRGGIGLYCWQNRDARFSDVRVDDFRSEAPVVYDFEFTTSRFANFFHHMHSFQDETWRLELPVGTDLASLAAHAVLLTTLPADDEVRAYETLANEILGPAARQNPPEVQVTRVVRDGEALALWIQSPEPIDWKRTTFELQHADRFSSLPQLPGNVKLTDVTFANSQPIEESVSLMLRQAVDLTGHRIEHHRFPGALAELAGNPVLFSDEFDGRDRGLLFREQFGPNALDRYTIVNEGKQLGPSDWAMSGGQIVQRSAIYGGSVDWDVPDKPGTLALTGLESWENVHIKVSVWSTENAAIGLVFRYRDSDHYYRFSMHRDSPPTNIGPISRQRSYRRLIKKTAGGVTVLWQDHVTYNLDQSYQLGIEAHDDQLLAYLDDVLLFSVRDPDIVAGRVGLYCWNNRGAHFEALEVESLEVPPVLWQPAFADSSEVEIVDEPGAIEGPSNWAAENGALTQSSSIRVEDNTAHRPGTYALGGSVDWRDVTVSVRLRSIDEDAIGVMFRYQDRDNYYRFSMDRQASYQRLIKKVGGSVTVLQELSGQYASGQIYDLTIRAIDGVLSIYLDGVRLFTVADDDLKTGRIGFYCWANSGARFGQVVVVDRTHSVGGWIIHDESKVSPRSVWKLSSSTLRQLVAHGSTYPGFGRVPEFRGTYAFNGDPTWTDYRLIVRLRSDDADAIGVMFRYVDEDNYYRLALDARSPYRRLIKKENGNVSLLWADRGSYAVGEPFTLTVDAIGSRLAGYQGDALLFDETDNAHPAGQVALYCWDNTGARFEQIEVRRLPPGAYTLYHDRFISGDWNEWKPPIDNGTRNAPSQWATFQGTLRETSGISGRSRGGSYPGTHVVTGDSTWTDVVVSVRLRSAARGAIGLLFRYVDEDHYYRFSMHLRLRNHILAKNIGGTFTTLGGGFRDTDANRTYELTLTAIGNRLHGYFDNVPIFAVEDHDLPAGRIGIYCSRNEDARFAQVRVYSANAAFNDWLLDDPFDFQIPGRWTFVEEGDQGGPAQWDMTSGELRQSSSIYGGSTDPTALDKPGTYALAGEAAWTNYRVSVPLHSDSDGAIGVMFRYKDEKNYYRFSMDRQGSYWRLIKNLDGSVSKLWERGTRIRQRQVYMVVLDCFGDRLTGYINGERLFTVTDGDLTSGKIALYCWRNPAAHFGEVRVIPSVWTPYYTFEPEARLPAGTRVRVHAGSVNDLPEAELQSDTGVVRRFVASLDERGRSRLPGDSVDLRVVSSGDERGHMRTFLPGSDYAPVDVRVLRKADGTAFFMVMPTGDAFAPGQYRLKATYHRNNRTPDAESQVFSEAGNSNAERLTLDVPWETLMD